MGKESQEARNMNVIVDSAILVDHFREFKPAKEVVKRIEKGEVVGYLSAITEAELLAGKECENIEIKKRVENTVKLFTKIIVDNSISQKAGEFSRKYSVKIPDAIIAATAFYQKCKLWTKNKKDFEKIKEIEMEEPY